MGIGLVLWSVMTFGAPMQSDDVCVALIPKVHEAAQTTDLNTKMGIASFYHKKFEGRLTANGEVFDNTLFTCASNYYKLGTYLKITNMNNQKVVYVKVNDRMGHPGRTVDLTVAAAEHLSFVNRGLTKVKIEKISSDIAKQQIVAQNNLRNNKEEDVAQPKEDSLKAIMPGKL